MENLNPTLNCVIQIRHSIECGEPLRPALKKYLLQTTDEVSEAVVKLLVTSTAQEALSLCKTPFRYALILIFERGLRGEAILPHLLQLQEELVHACNQELEKRILTLPMQALIPLLLFQFPALIILFFAPFLYQLANSL